jgi:solute carrier family 25 (mitochondrial phosphate transporter), member 3
VTPLDLVKCRRQVDSKLYKSNIEGWSRIYRGEGLRGVFTGWSPTFFGYSVSRLIPRYIILNVTNILFQAQGAFKYGGYEFFKHFYSDLVGEETSRRWRTSLYLAASASAEFIADIALCPFEAAKVRMQTTIPPFAKGTFDGISKITGKEGVAG